MTGHVLDSDVAWKRPEQHHVALQVEGYDGGFLPTQR